MADNFLVALTAYFNQTIGVIHATSQYLIKNEELIELYRGVKDFKERYPIIKKAKDLTQKRVSEITEAFKTIKEVKPTVLAEVITPYSPTVLQHHAGVTNIAFLLRQINFKDLVPYLNTEYFQRLTTKGRKQNPFMNTTDWTNTKDLIYRSLKDH
jgi:hypothetical protein